MRNIDLNADIGEGYLSDKEVLKYISSANIACGLHAGSPTLITETIQLAKNAGVAIGAHPGYPDKEGFGRKKMDLSERDLFSYLNYQLGAIDSLARAQDYSLSHVKAHGALYNASVKDLSIAKIIVLAVKNLKPSLLLFGPAGSILETEAKKEGIRFISEVFADRGYNDDATLVKRGLKGDLIRDVSEATERALLMINKGIVKAVNGTTIKVKAETICLHGDNEKAILFAKELKRNISESGINIKSL